MGIVLTSYLQALDYLFARTTGKNKLGLERVSGLLEVLGNPQQRLRVFHVAGTNGKGSVCATLEAVLRAQGRRVGKYTSPHLVDFRERLVVNGVPIEPAFVVEFVERHVGTVERLGATFFEATTAMAFDWFVRQAVDVLVLETGLGGRLDATNVVQPIVAGVSSISIDHVEYLGDTRQSIAMEKAGIYKSGAGAVVGEPDRGIAALLAASAERVGAAPIIDVWREVPPSDVRVDAAGTEFSISLAGETARLRIPLTGTHQASNASVALAMLHAAGGTYRQSLASMQDGLAAVRLPGRIHRVGQIIFDVAHNEDGAAVLADTLQALRVARPVKCLMCALADKDWRHMMDMLASEVDEFIFVNAPTAPTSRMWRLGDVQSYAAYRGYCASIDEDFDRAIDAALTNAATTLITGSFHTVGDAMARLQVDPLAQ